MQETEAIEAYKKLKNMEENAQNELKNLKGWKFHPLFWLRATTYWKAFILGALVIAVSTTISLRLRDYLVEKGWNETAKSFVTGLVTAAAAFITYYILHFFCGFGGGMLASPLPHREQSIMGYLYN